MPTSKALGVPLGQFIELPLYDEISALAWKALQSKEHQQLFAGAWNGLGYRCQAAAWHNRALRAALLPEPAANHVARAQQERDLFGLVMNIAAGAECLAFGAYVVSLGVDGRDLSDKLLRPNFSDQLSCLASNKLTEPLGVFLESALDQPPAVTLYDVRDVLVHRGVLLRWHWAGGPHDGKVTVPEKPKSVPHKWQPSLVLGTGLVDGWCDWFKSYVDEAMPLLHNALEATLTQ